MKQLRWLLAIIVSISLISFYPRPDHQEGEFKIRGLKEGNYSLWVDGIDGYRDTLITDINVRRGKETDLGTIILKK